MTNLERAFSHREREVYESLLDGDFWFTETDCLGELVLANDREEELLIMGSRDGSSKGIFSIYRTINWSFQPVAHITELGRDYPDAFEGDPDGHPDEDWEVFRGRVEILLLRPNNDGVAVSQTMNFKLRQGEDGLWRIVRWVDDPLSGDCSGAGSARPAGTTSWGGSRQVAVWQ
ncbi:MAG: hypothetical protein HN712_08060 [Gemmatimonadetes bacterium]|jgi:hypothetical protein|nr:hypothetical protein [Gemmatimonadota bacterium]MBT6150134.1 hypothetical protein [Gemmatimonadota bacterium]MBT7860253.1 hypothetical protein [Gemmatimonadota bacterium]